MSSHKKGRRLTRAERRRRVIRNRIIFGCCCFVVLIAIAVGISLTVKSCRQKKSEAKLTYKSSQIHVKKDKSLTLAYVEDFSKDYYNEAELKKNVENEIASFNSNSKFGKMEISQFVVKDGKAYLYLKAETLDTYKEYFENYMYQGQECKMTIGTMGELEEDGAMLLDHYKNVKNGKAVDKIDLSDQKSLMVIYTTQGEEFSVDGNILYVSDKVEMDGSIAKTTDGEDNYIIYEEEEAS